MGVEIKDLEKEYSLEDMQVFRMDESEWIAAPSLLHALVEYDKQVGLEIEYLQDIEQTDLEKEGMWSGEEISELEYIKFGKHELNLHEEGKPKFGEFKVVDGVLCKFTSFADVIRQNGMTGTYIIACTE